MSKNKLLDAVAISSTNSNYDKYKNVVEKADRMSRNNTYEFSKILYDEWVNSEHSEEVLIAIYRAMSLKGFSTYELNKMTGKRLIDRGRNNGGYALIDYDV